MRRTGFDKFGDPIFIKVVGGEDLGMLQTGVIQNFAAPAGQFAKIAAIETHAPNGLAQLRGQVSAGDSVVGVDEKDGRFAEQFLQRAEAALFVAESHGPRVRGGAEHRDIKRKPASALLVPEQPPTKAARRPERQRRANGRAGCRIRRWAGLRPPTRSAPLWKRPWSGKHESGEQVCFHQLRFDQRRAHNGDGFVGKDRSAFGQGKQIAGEAQLR
jgi:hypothetical protein